MMKHPFHFSLTVLLLIAAQMLFASCRQRNYVIHVHGDGLKEGDTLFLTNDLRTFAPIDTAMVKDGKTEFRNATDTTFFAAVYKAGDARLGTTLFVEPGHISVLLSNKPGESKVSGTPTNEKWIVINDSIYKIGVKINNLANQLYQPGLTEEQQKQYAERINSYSQEFTTYVTENARKNINNELGVFILTFYENDIIEPAVKKELITQLPQHLRNRASIKQLEKTLDYQLQRGEGSKMKDFTMLTPENEQTTLLSGISKHQFTIIDVWASWCGPCRREMPILVELYNTYHDKGLDIIGISLDQNEADWKAAIKQLGIKWRQMSVLNGWKNPLVEYYSIESIPHTIIIDQEGRILKIGLRGEQLKSFLETKLK